MQWPLWLPPRGPGFQCSVWHSRLQYVTLRHFLHCLLTLSLPVTVQPVLAHGISPVVVAFFFPILICEAKT